MDRKKGITGSTLKMVGIITMLIDHAAVVILTRELYSGMQQGGEMSEPLFLVYRVMRGIGRLGFPIFCFLLAEGFGKTRNVGKYAFRLGLFALISEIPFDLALTSQVMEFGHQNVYFTLFLGLVVLWAFKCLERLKLSGPVGVLACAVGVLSVATYVYCMVGGKPDMNGIVLYVVACLVVAADLCILGVKKDFSRAAAAGADLSVLCAAMALADFLRTDYAGIGVLTIAAMYLCRRQKVLSMLAGCLVLAFFESGSEIYALFALVPVALYNGKRGLKMKYAFYVFYPAHLLILYLIAVLLGIGQISAV